MTGPRTTVASYEPLTAHWTHPAAYTDDEIIVLILVVQSLAGRQRAEVRRAEVCAAKFQASLEQVFNLPFMFIRSELSDACAERSADRWAGSVESRGHLVGQQVSGHFQCVPSRGRVRAGDVVGL